MSRLKSAVSAMLIALGLTACAAPAPADGYIQITPEQAKDMMDSQPACIILDVRAESEYMLGHIPGAIVIPHDEITARAPRELPDKNACILVYCRSGRRSKIAAEALVALGYTQVYEFGGINDWPYTTTR
jgi:rhodanese-related sulfurtransferase